MSQSIASNYLLAVPGSACTAAGANQVAIQVLSADDDILPGARALAQLL